MGLNYATYEQALAAYQDRQRVGVLDGMHRVLGGLVVDLRTGEVLVGWGETPPPDGEPDPHHVQTVSYMGSTKKTDLHCVRCGRTRHNGGRYYRVDGGLMCFLCEAAERGDS